MALAIHTSAKRRWPIVLVSFLIAGLLAISGWLLYRWYAFGDELPFSVPALATADPRIDETPVTKEQVGEHTVAPAEPRYLSIPSLDVAKTRVFSVGIDANNMLESPANIDDTAWYKNSATPGSGGVVLIDGHNGGMSRNGVFAELRTMKPGDLIEIERGDGKVLTYEVRENESWALEDVNKTGMQRMMQSVEPGKEALNIITCDGKWIPRFEQFDRRILLRAVLVE